MSVHHVLRGSVLAVLLTAAAAQSVSAQIGRVGGVVKDERGEPIRGAVVIAENPDVKPDSLTTTTDDKGRFAMIGLRSGTWLLTAYAPGFIGQTGDVIVRQGPGVRPVAFSLRKLVAPPSVLGSVAANDLQTELAAADQLYNNMRWDQAITAYRTILAATPALTVINLQIAAAYRNKREFDKAISVYNDLLKVDPNNDKAKIGIALTSVEKGDLQAAEQSLEIAAQAPGATREVFYNLGEVKLSKNMADEATRAYERASRADPSWGKPLFALGRVAMNKGNKGGAIRYFEKVIEIDPMSPEAAQARTSIEQLEK